ncbi:MAG: hypothetical protein AAGD07_23765 [Planctomycetota bacterium]
MLVPRVVNADTGCTYTCDILSSDTVDCPTGTSDWTGSCPNCYLAPAEHSSGVQLDEYTGASADQGVDSSSNEYTCKDVDVLCFTSHWCEATKHVRRGCAGVVIAICDYADTTSCYTWHDAEPYIYEIDDTNTCD